MKRRLAAILAADVAGYSRLMGADEAGTLSAINRHRKELIEPKARQYNGRTVKLMGDGALMEFASAVDAVAFAAEVQCAMRERVKDVPKDQRIVYRIGINIGDIIIEDGDIFGDGVNVAARLEALAEPGGICVARSVFDQVKGKLDLTFRPLGNRKVKNIAESVSVYRLLLDDKAEALVTDVPPDASARTMRRGYVAAALALLLFVGGFIWWQPWTSRVAPGPAELAGQASRRMADKPSIAVLPFSNISEDAAQKYFSDGITADLITDLSKVSGLFVIARNSSFAYSGRAVNLREVGRELGVRYVLEGSVQKAAGHIRITARLIDTNSGGHVWADRFDRELSDVFALQDEVVQKIVAALSVKLRPSEKERLSRSAQAHPEAYDLLLRGLETYWRFTRETIVESREFFERAIALAPSFARAHAALALSHIMAVELGLSDEPRASTQEALRIARRALSLDATVREVHFVLSIIYRTLGRHDEAIAAARQAIALDPNYADGYALLAINLNFAGKPDEGLAAIQRAMQLNPRHPFFYVWIQAQSYYLLGRYEQAAKQFERVKTSNPEFVAAHKMLAATYSALGRADDAEWAVAELKTLVPNYSLEREGERAPYKDAEVFRRYLERLRKAGLR